MHNLFKNHFFWICVLLIILLVVSFLGFYCFKQNQIIKTLTNQYDEIKNDLDKTKEQLKGATESLEKKEEELSKLKKDYKNLENLKSNKENAPKTIYLTFDDGPSENTIKILDLLKQYKIKATFFTIGGQDEAIYKRIVKEGHTLANHTNEHEYSVVYKSTDAFWQSFEKHNAFIKKLTGKDNKIMRFPGGSNNTVSNKYSYGIMNTLTKQAKEKGYIYHDWNVSSLDAVKNTQDENVIVNTVLKEVRDWSRPIILFHDSSPKTTTVSALKRIIPELVGKGYKFDKIDESVTPVQYLK